MDLSEKDRADRLSKLAEEDSGLAEQVRDFLDESSAWSVLERPPRAAQKLFELFDETPERVGPYRLVRELGRGGMGTVYLATRDDGAYRSEVAVKILKRGMDTDELIRRFLDERQILAQLDHPHIARLLDGGATPDGRPYLVMTFVPGEAIHKHSRHHGLSLSQRLDLFKKVCHAVHFAHRNLVIHRDLKPGNILVTPGGEPKLLDFGIAKLMNSRKRAAETTAAGLRPMTPEYAAPEQLKGEPATTATDIYGLGLILFHLLTGGLPIDGNGSEGEIMKRSTLDRNPIRPSEMLRRARKKNSWLESGEVPPIGWRDVRGDLDNIVLMALRKEPERRYGSAAELEEDITRYERGLPVRARGDTLGYVAGKFIRRHFMAVPAALLVFFALVVLVFTLNNQKEVARAERDRANRVLHFIDELFQSGDPYSGRVQPMLDLEMLDHAIAGIRRQFSGDPMTQADLMSKLGEIYLHRGQFESAGTILEEALALRRAHLGDSHPEVALDLERLATLRNEQGRPDDALPLGLKAHDIQIAALGQKHPDLAITMDQLAVATQEKRRFDEAESWYRKSLAIKRAHYPAIHRQIAITQQGLAALYRERGRYDEAERLFHEARATYETLHGTGHPANGYILNNLALLYRQTDRYPEAEKLYLQVRAINEKAFGKGHPNLLAVLKNLAVLYQEWGRLDEAESLLHQVLESQNTWNSKPAASWYNNLGKIYYRQGRLDEAEEYYQCAIGDNTNPHPAYLNNLAMLFKKRGDAEKAKAYLRHTLQITGRIYGEDHVHYARVLANIAQVHAETGSCSDSAMLHLEALLIRENKLGPAHRDVGKSLYHLAKAEYCLDRTEAAYGLCRQAVAVLEDVKGAEPELIQARDLLQRLTLDQTGKPGPSLK